MSCMSYRNISILKKMRWAKIIKGEVSRNKKHMVKFRLINGIKSDGLLFL